MVFKPTGLEAFCWFLLGFFLLMVNKTTKRQETKSVVDTNKFSIENLNIGLESRLTQDRKRPLVNVCQLQRVRYHKNPSSLP